MNLPFILAVLLAVGACVLTVRGRSGAARWAGGIGLVAAILIFALGRGPRVGHLPPEIDDATFGTLESPGELSVVKAEARNAVPHYQPEKNRPQEMAGDGYVTSTVCQSCHAHEHETWRDSYHRTMTQVPTSDSVMGDFGDVTVTNHDSGHRFTMNVRSNRFWITGSRLSNHIDVAAPEGRDAVPAPNGLTDGNHEPLAYPVALLTGSHHMQGYWTPNGLGRTLSLLPVMYLKEEKKWIPRASVFLQPPGGPHGIEAGRWNSVCIQCHATAGESRVVEPFGYHDTKVAEFGISCESCHGPGEEHVLVRRAAAKAGKTTIKDDPIVNPVSLSHERSSQVCGVCHGRRQRRAGAGDNPFRPGDDLHEKHLVFRRTPAVMAEIAKTLEPGGPAKTVEEEMDFGFWKDGLSRSSATEYNGLIDSPCYQRGEMGCFSCHQLHQSKRDSRSRKDWANDQLRHAQDTDTACRQCHEDARYAASEHTHHAPGSTGSGCYNCHMPHTSYGLMKAIRSHAITSPDVKSTIVTTRPNACNLCHLDKTLEWTAGHLSDWYGIAKPELNGEQKKYSAAALDVLKGNAGLRALTAWNMGWKPAVQTSGQEWLVPFLAGLLDDPYDTVRYIAWRSLKRIPGQEEMDYDFVGSAAGRRLAAQKVLADWMAKPERGEESLRVELLLDENGQFQQTEADRLMAGRDNRPVLLKE
jgi:hypothetical protein